MRPISLRKMSVLVAAGSGSSSYRGRHGQILWSRLFPRKMWRLRRVLLANWRMITVTALTVTTIYLVFAIRSRAVSSSKRKSYGGARGFHMFFAPEDEFEQEFADKSRLPPSIETMEEKPTLHTGDALLSYFLTMYVDGMEITWSSAVNTRQHLFKSLQDYMLMMLEADVHVKWKDPAKKTNGTALIAPSTKQIDEDSVDLDRYLYYIARYSNKGVQLNFADMDTANIALPMLSKMKTQVHAPIWLHADILPGPNKAEVPVDPVRFVTAVQQRFPSSTLALGWATDWNPDAAQVRYSWSNVIDMAKICAGVRQPVSFNIRAVYALKSMRQLRFLLSLTNRFTLTIWTEMYDIMPLPDLVLFRRSMDPKRIHYNLPNNFMDSIKNVNGQQAPPPDTGTIQWNRNLWQPVLLDDISLVFLGLEQAVLEGPASWLVSKIPYQAELQSKGRTVVLEGKIQFVNNNPADLPLSDGFRIIIRSSGVNPPPPNEVQGVQLLIRLDGFIELSEVNMKHAIQFDLRTSAHLPRNDCYEFKLVDRGEDIPIYCEVKLTKCEKDEADLEPLSVSLHFKAPYESGRQMFYVVVSSTGGKQPLIVEGLVVYS